MRQTAAKSHSLSGASTATTSANQPEQLVLLDEAFLWGVDVAQLKREREELRQSERSPATARAYASDWKHFTEWCASARRVPLPASEDTLELYVAACSLAAKISTLRRRVSAIAAEHRAAGEGSPVGEGVRAVLYGVARRKGSEQARKAALTPAQLLAISEALPAAPHVGGVRDRALLVLGFATGCRRSELAALRVSDLRWEQGGRALLVNIRSSKTDQAGEGVEIAVWRASRSEVCPLRTVRSWLKLRGSADGPLFLAVDREGGAELREPRQGISGEAVSDAVQRAVSLIGLDPREYGGHSLRAGMVTAAHAAGASDTAIMARSRHKDVGTLVRYIRRTSALAAPDVLAKAL